MQKRGNTALRVKRLPTIQEARLAYCHTGTGFPMKYRNVRKNFLQFQLKRHDINAANHGTVNECLKLSARRSSYTHYKLNDLNVSFSQPPTRHLCKTVLFEFYIAASASKEFF